MFATCAVLCLPNVGAVGDNRRAGRVVRLHAGRVQQAGSRVAGPGYHTVHICDFLY